MDSDAIRKLLSDLGITDAGASCLVLSYDSDASSISAKEIGVAEVRCLGGVASVADLDGLGRYSLAIVVGQPGQMRKRDVVHLLARLRDRYAERVALREESSNLSSSELMALGFVRFRRASGRFYVYDPDTYFEPREWNNSRQWANPENFRKYRW